MLIRSPLSHPRRPFQISIMERYSRTAGCRCSDVEGSARVQPSLPAIRKLNYFPAACVRVFRRRNNAGCLAVRTTLKVDIRLFFITLLVRFSTHDGRQQRRRRRVTAFVSLFYGDAQETCFRSLQLEFENVFKDSTALPRYHFTPSCDFLTLFLTKKNMKNNHWILFRIQMKSKIAAFKLKNNKSSIQGYWRFFSLRIFMSRTQGSKQKPKSIHINHHHYRARRQLLFYLRCFAIS